jgi:hypothetical protein
MMAKVKKAATLKEVVTEKKAAPRTRKPRVSKKVDAAKGKETTESAVYLNQAADGPTAERMRQATKPAKTPTLEQIVAKLEKHGIRFNDEE